MDLLGLARDLVGLGIQGPIATFNTLHGNETRIDSAGLKSLLGGILSEEVAVIGLLAKILPIPSPRGLAQLRRAILWADICLLTPYYVSDAVIHILCRLAHRPLISNQSNVIQRNGHGNVKDATQDLYMRVFGVRLLLRSDLVRVWNKDYQSFLRERNARRVFLLYPTVTVTPGDCPPNQLEIQHDLARIQSASADVFRVLIAGRMTFQKGVDIIAKVIDRKRQGVSIAGCKLIIYLAGTSHVPESVAPLLGAQPGCEVVNLGVLTQLELRNCMSQVDLVWMPSRYETFGRVAMESISVGTPVLASDIPGLRDVVIPGTSGLLVAGWNSDDHFNALEDLSRMKRDDPAKWLELRRSTFVQFHERFGSGPASKAVREFAARLQELVGSA